MKSSQGNLELEALQTVLEQYAIIEGVDAYKAMQKLPKEDLLNEISEFMSRNMDIIEKEYLIHKLAENIDA